MGLTATGKSSIAKWIARKIDADIYHSALIRNDLGYDFSLNEAEGNFFTYENNNRLKMDDKVYKKMLKKAVLSLNKKKDVILDAGHFFYKQRKRIYIKTNNYNLEKIIIQTVCKENIVKIRLKKRVKDFSNNPLNETPSFKAYQSAKNIVQNPSRYEINEEISSLIQFDTNSGRLINIGNKELNNKSKLIFQLLERTMDIIN